MNDPHLGFRGQHPIPRHAINACPTSIGTYAALHLDSVGKILNHFLFLTVIIDVFLFLSSFAVSYLPNHMGPNTVLCSFLLAAVPVTSLLIVNNSRISALSVLAPTEFMIGVATGLTIGAAVLSFILSSSYKTVRHCSELHNTEQATTHNNHSGNHSAASDAIEYDPVFTTACSNTTSMTGIYFWAGLSAWLNVVTAMLLVTGRHELSEHFQHYETIGGANDGGNNYNDNNPHMSGSGSHDFEETFRRQQQEILGASQAAAIQNRAASMFVGDYSSIPEVRTHTTSQNHPANSSLSTVTLASSQQGQAQPLNSSSNNNSNKQKKDPQVLAV